MRQNGGKIPLFIHFLNGVILSIILLFLFVELLQGIEAGQFIFRFIGLSLVFFILYATSIWLRRYYVSVVTGLLFGVVFWILYKNLEAAYCILFLFFVILMTLFVFLRLRYAVLIYTFGVTLLPLVYLINFTQLFNGDFFAELHSSEATYKALFYYFIYASLTLVSGLLVSNVAEQRKRNLRKRRQGLRTIRKLHQKNVQQDKLMRLFTELSSDYVYMINLEDPALAPEIHAGSFERITGFTPEEIKARGGWLEIIHEDDRERIRQALPILLANKPVTNEYRIITGTDEIKWLRDSIRPVMDEDSGQIVRLMGAVHEITREKIDQQKIETLAFYDPLTHLPNRRLLDDRIDQAIAYTARDNQYGALLLLDIDDFRILNDLQGHIAGDLLLMQFAQRLQGYIYDGDTLARLGGDEFVIVMSELGEDYDHARSRVVRYVEKILTELSKPIQLIVDSSSNYECTSSVGIVMFRGHELSRYDLIKNADLAMYRAKDLKKNSYRFFSKDMHNMLSNRIALENEIKTALAEEQFILYYQPQISSRDGIIGAEVLIRWQHPERKLISPVEFIPIAEKNGQIMMIGQWVLRKACQQLRSWADDPELSELRLSVNVSASQLSDPGFSDMVREILDTTQAQPHKLVLELTESAIMDNVNQTIENMRELNELGLKFSVDDFGTGYSSLSYLKKFPLAELKIDRDFIKDIDKDVDDALLVKAIIGIADNLGLRVLAEGVETQSQEKYLVANGCTNLQGYYYSKPLPMANFVEYFNQTRLANDLADFRLTI